MRTILLLLLALGCAPDDERVVDVPGLHIELGQLTLDVASGRRFFAVQPLDVPGETTFRATRGKQELEVWLRHQTAAGAPIEEGEGPLVLRADERVIVEVTEDGQTSCFLVAITPSDLPPVTVEGTPTEHFVFLTPRDYTVDTEIAPYADYLLIVDGYGTPVWWKRAISASFDFKVAGDGRLTANTRMDSEQGTRSYAFDPASGTVEDTWPGGGPAHWETIRVDAHEFQLRADGSILRTINGATVEDLTSYGGGPASPMWHAGVEELAPQGNLVARWTTEGNIDLDALPDEVWASEPQEGWWRYGHVNSVQAVDDGWLMSLRSPNQAVLVNPRTGEYVWKVGGADSDVVFVDDPRNGFYGQHSARIWEPDHLLVFDNGTNFGSPTTGDVRAVEYRLDFGASTATRTWEYALEGAGGTHYAGLIQRMSDGGMLIGWGSTQEQAGERSPSVTILDADRNWESHLRLPLGMYTYRAYAFTGDPITGVWDPAGG